MFDIYWWKQACYACGTWNGFHKLDFPSISQMYLSQVFDCRIVLLIIISAIKISYFLNRQYILYSLWSVFTDNYCNKPHLKLHMGFFKKFCLFMGINWYNFVSIMSVFCQYHLINVKVVVNNPFFWEFFCLFKTRWF